MRPAAVRIVAAGLVGMPATCCLAQRVEIGELRQDFARCRALPESGARLACYDKLADRLVPPTFQGSLADELPQFTITQPTLLRYQSDGPIFVMYLKNAEGAVVQNLHIGGGGESMFLIEKPGTYNLQVSGTDTWRIWVEPQAPAPPHG